MDGNTIRDGGEMSGQEINDMITLSEHGWKIGHSHRYAGGEVTNQYPKISRTVQVGPVQYGQSVFHHKGNHGNWHTSCTLTGTIDNKMFNTLEQAVSYLDDWRPTTERQLEALNAEVVRLRAEITALTKDVNELKHD